MVACISSEKVAFYDIATGEMLASMDKGEESSYGSAHAFSDDKTKFAVSHFDRDSTGGLVTVYDFAGGTSKSYPVAESYVPQVGFCADGGLIAVSIKGAFEFLECSFDELAFFYLYYYHIILLIFCFRIF